ncbi:carboxylesterase/lipase family protein [Branchiibius sp. NY16-3462-2]|uniref:carboxylesterase/lipase family protein n=1 Tax=Branchiibius sp. NY16-3462-2 TaxID=1807500 RepID=UPI00079C00C4|nr:carboxylesterase/lipase family protein [Branchiibius sp. NY16-3462-2]KYH44683.1 carboxylesterase [Branchiibius sp. NY16-3462-2]
MTQTSLTAQAPAGNFTGRTDDGVTSWRGIRYALAPAGDRRWRAPVAAPRVEKDVYATEFGPVCPQKKAAAVPMPVGAVFDEDCLSLNVWAPKERCEPLPVMVWVHGGAYTFGASSQPLYDATSLVKTGGIIVVTINYRLGGFGFVDLTGVLPDADNNLALRDVLLALRWVQDNIAAFGGDTGRVTVAGESAGGGLVTTLLATPSAQGLFQRAIAQSAPASSVYGPDRSHSVADLFVKQLGVAQVDSATLRAVPAEQIVSAAMEIYTAVPASDPGVLPFTPVIDGDLLPESPDVVLREGRGLVVPLLIGTNKDEAALFKFMKSPLVPISQAGLDTMYADMHQDNPGMELPSKEQVLGAYENVRYKVLGMGIARDLGFRMPTVWAADGHSAIAPTYLYRFDYATPFFRLIKLGATHATELPYLWGNLSSGPKDPTFLFGGRRKGEGLSRRMQERWTAFVKGEEPNCAGGPDWTSYDHDRRATLVIDAGDTLVDDLDADIRSAWGEQVISFH